MQATLTNKSLTTVMSQRELEVIVNGNLSCYKNSIHRQAKQ